eukprot:2422120-Pleurochrysis_carterae.AAC.2
MVTSVSKVHSLVQSRQGHRMPQILLRHYSWDNAKGEWITTVSLHEAGRHWRDKQNSFVTYDSNNKLMFNYVVAGREHVASMLAWRAAYWTALGKQTDLLCAMLEQ